MMIPMENAERLLGDVVGVFVDAPEKRRELLRQRILIPLSNLAPLLRIPLLQRCDLAHVTDF